MWIGKEARRVIQQSDLARFAASERASQLQGEKIRLEIENERLRNDIKWFMHRLNQVEMERAALVFQATGTRIAAPQFKEAPDPAEADVMNGLGAPFAGVGEDSADPADQIPDHAEEYSHLPGYKR